jgi:Nif-specific regulatory protein
VFAYLTMTVGSRVGATFPLDPDRENKVGRDSECVVVLTDGMCSRVHAVLARRDGQWQIADAGSRNGTYVNGQKVDTASLADGHEVKVGDTTFAFREQEVPPTVTDLPAAAVTQTVVQDVRIDASERIPSPLPMGRESAQVEDLLLLYQLSVRLLGCTDPGEVMRTALDLLQVRTGASLVGFLWVDDEGKLKPKLSLPEQAGDRVVLSESLTRLVLNEGRAVWIASHHAGDPTDSLRHYADALCAPLIHEGAVLGAVHVYLDRGKFRQPQFDFTISVAGVTAVALARARRQESDRSDLKWLKAGAPGFDELVGESPPMRDLKAKIGRVARAVGCVLIRGENGTGKELVARALHRASPRADRPLVSVNCAAIPESLMESHLFGHRAGSFTGADQGHIGYFQQADLGTLFLDEVGELSLAGQSKLLRVLEGHPFQPVGGTEAIRVDVRLIAATNQDLQTYVREKRFREDLYYRLSVFELSVPPLRERGEDVERLVDFFLSHFCRQHHRPGLALSDAARKRLLAYRWPGNVRQLRNVMDSAVVLAAGSAIEPVDLQLRDSGSEAIESLRLDYWEQKLIAEALLRTGRNVPEAAKLLGIGRATLYRKIEEYGIER